MVRMADSRLRHRRPNSDELSRWFHRAKERDEGALEQLLALYRPLLIQLAKQRITGALCAKIAPSDIAQATVWKAAQDFDPDQFAKRKDFAAWLLTILKHELADARRRFQIAQKRDVSRERPLFSQETQQWLVQLSARLSNGPNSDLKCIPDIDEVLGAVGRLPPHYQLVIRLRYFERLRFEEIGQKLERSADAARVLHNRAIEKLQNELL